MIDAIKTIIKNYIKDYAIGDFVVGTITNTKPLEVTLESNRLVLTAIQLEILEGLTRHETKNVANLIYTVNKDKDGKSVKVASNSNKLEYSDDMDNITMKRVPIELRYFDNNLGDNEMYTTIEEIQMYPKLKKNDKLFLYKKNGGQKFVIIDKIGNLNNIVYEEEDE